MDSRFENEFEQEEGRLRGPQPAPRRGCGRSRFSWSRRRGI